MQPDDPQFSGAVGATSSPDSSVLVRLGWMVGAGCLLAQSVHL